MPLKIAVLFGGRSGEYPVSLRSAAFVISSLRLNPDYELLRMGIDRKGRFYLFNGEDSAIPGDQWKTATDCEELLLAPHCGFLRRNAGASQEWIHPDLLFPVLHGQDGEGGPLQGLMESLDLPFVGCRTLGAAAMMDKDVAKRLFAEAGLAQTPWLCLRDTGKSWTEAALQEQTAAAGLHYPLFVKPANAGSSLGISKVREPGELAAAVAAAAQIDRKVLIEEAVVGRELEVAVMEETDGSLRVSDPGEILPGRDFYDYEDKYAADSRSRLQIPAELSAAIREKIRSAAARAFRAGECRGLARCDFFLRQADGAVLINEINTMPGFTSISMWPKLMLASGLSPQKLMRHLVDAALAGNS